MLGIVLLIVGLGLVAAGAVVAAVLGRSGTLTSAPATVTGNGVALVADEVAVDAGSVPVPSSLADLSFVVASSNGDPVFVGAAPAPAVEHYLAGAPYDVVVSLEQGTTATTRRVPGTQQPPPPGTESFWVMQSSGAPATVRSVPSGTTLVIMNADATPGVAVTVTARLVVRNSWTAAWVAVGVGVLALVLAVVAFWRARVAGRRRREALAAGAAGSPATVLPASAEPEPAAPPAPEVPAARARDAAGEPLAIAEQPAGVEVAPAGADAPAPGQPERDPRYDVAPQAPSASLAALVAEAGRPSHSAGAGDNGDAGDDGDDAGTGSPGEFDPGEAAGPGSGGAGAGADGGPGAGSAGLADSVDGVDSMDSVGSDESDDSDDSDDPVFAAIAERFGLRPGEEAQDAPAPNPAGPDPAHLDAADPDAADPDAADPEPATDRDADADPASADPEGPADEGPAVGGPAGSDRPAPGQDADAPDGPHGGPSAAGRPPG